jgi:hypothetical protein
MSATKTWDDYLNKAQLLVRDKAQIMLESEDAEAALEQAADTLTFYRRDQNVTEYTATDTRLYALPELWDDEMSPGSYLLEYPVDDNAVEVTYLKDGMTEIYNTPTGWMLRFRGLDLIDDELPSVGQKFRLHYATPYLLTPDKVTIPDSLFGAVSKLCARELCLIAAPRFAQNQSGTAVGGVGSYEQKDTSFLKLADQFMADFLRKVAPDPKERPGHAVFGSFIGTPLDRYATPLYPRDRSLRPYTDR